MDHKVKKRLVLLFLPAFIVVTLPLMTRYLKGKAKFFVPPFCAWKSDQELLVKLNKKSSIASFTAISG